MDNSGKIKVSVVSYLNSKPFVYGIERASVADDIVLSLDIPSVCAEKLASGEVDMGLVPVAAIPDLKHAFIVSDFCIGAVGPVKTVMLYSMVPLDRVKKVLLDYQSRTSVMLARILAKELWGISPVWEKAEKGFEDSVNGDTAAVVIGDRTFAMNGSFPFEYDLSEEWHKLTGLPFVFACWVANKKLPDDFLNRFNSALGHGLENIPSVLAGSDSSFDLEGYLTRDISYNLDERKRQALDLFLLKLGLA
jgi:chorismate dehydratase